MTASLALFVFLLAMVVAMLLAMGFIVQVIGDRVA